MEETRMEKKNQGSLRPRVSRSSHCQSLCLGASGLSGKFFPIGGERMKKEETRGGNGRGRGWGEIVKAKVSVLGRLRWL